MLRRAQSKLSGNVYSTHSPVIPLRLEPPCVSYSPYVPPPRIKPLSHRRTSARACYAPLHATSSHNDLMRTADYRHVEYPSLYRSSFDLSDILEESDVEIEIVSEVLPSSPVSTRSSSTFKSTISLSNVKQKLKGVVTVTAKIPNVVARLRSKYKREGPSAVSNDGTKIGLDLIHA